MGTAVIGDFAHAVCLWGRYYQYRSMPDVLPSPKSEPRSQPFAAPYAALLIDEWCDRLRAQNRLTACRVLAPRPGDFAHPATLLKRLSVSWSILVTTLQMI